MSENNTEIEIKTRTCKICLGIFTLDKMRSAMCRKCISKRQNEALGKEYFKNKYEEQKEHRKEYSKKRYDYLSQCKKDIESQKNV